MGGRQSGSGLPGPGHATFDTLKDRRSQYRPARDQSERLNKKWYDNVVIAKSYIGPMTPLTSPTPSPTVFPDSHSYADSYFNANANANSDTDANTDTDPRNADANTHTAFRNSDAAT